MIEEIESAENIRNLLRCACIAAGGQTEWGKRHGVSQSQVSGVCSGERSPGRKVAAKLGFELKTVYVRRNRE